MCSVHYAVRGMSVLVVEESVAVATLLADIFTEQDALVICAHDPFHAMGLLLTARFDLVTVEVASLGSRRTRVLEFIRDCRKDLLPRTLAITAYRYDECVMSALESMQIPCLLKPFDVEELLTLCGRIAKGSRPTVVA